MARAATVVEMRQRAIYRALANGGAAAVTRIKCGHYLVQSATRPGLTHTVRVDGATWHCTCEAAVAGRASCWHRAAVLIAKTEHVSGAKVTGPATQAGEEASAPAPANVIPLRRA